jgi:hypothetical protein
MNYDDREHELCIAMQTIEKLEARIDEMYAVIKVNAPSIYVRMKKQHDEEDKAQ